uniref:Uncharacterized protein n=1 Tax=Noctiluca scintillans TaxID=2966 RepID=A0A7S1FB96_NOCSC
MPIAPLDDTETLRVDIIETLVRDSWRAEPSPPMHKVLPDDVVAMLPCGVGISFDNSLDGESSPPKHRVLHDDGPAHFGATLCVDSRTSLSRGSCPSALAGVTLKSSAAEVVSAPFSCSGGHLRRSNSARAPSRKLVISSSAEFKAHLVSAVTESKEVRAA